MTFKEYDALTENLHSCPVLGNMGLKTTTKGSQMSKAPIAKSGFTPTDALSRAIMDAAASVPAVARDENIRYGVPTSSIDVEGHLIERKQDGTTAIVKKNVAPRIK